MKAIGRKKYWLFYTLIFICLFFFCFGIYLLRYHKTILRFADTYDMHYMEFLYFGRWVRTAISTGQMPVWDPSIGYGSDFFLTMSCFICDPLNWIAIITPAKLAEIGFLIMVMLKLYLAGVSFSYFAFQRGHESYTVLCGAIVYTFCACAYVGMYQSIFINPMYVFPMLILGADRLFEGRRSVLYVAVLSYCALTSFYITYMAAILLVFYCLIKWIFREKDGKTGIKDFAALLVRFIVCSLLAAGIAALTLIPTAILMRDMGRLDLERYVPLHYHFDFYANMFRGFISTFDMQGRDCKIGFSVLALLCVFTLFITGHGRNRQQKIEFLLMTIGLSLPIVGHVMNGFGYVANRWIWAYAFLVSYIVTMELPQLRTLTISQWYVLVLCVGGYVIAGYEVFQAEGRAFLMLSVVLMMISAGCIHLHALPKQQFERLAIAVSCVTVILPAIYEYSYRYSYHFSSNIPAGQALERASTSGGLPLLDIIDCSDGSRFNRYGLSTIRNSSWLYGVGGMDFYMNLYNNSIDQFHNSVALNTGACSFAYNGLDRRSELLALLGVNHFFVRESYPYFPVTFDQMEAETVGREDVVQSWAPEEKYSIFSRFTQIVSYEDYIQLSPFERQDLLMKALVLEKDGTTSVKDMQLEGRELNFSVREEGDILYTGKEIEVYGQEDKLYLHFPTQQNAEIYVYFDNINYKYEDARGYRIAVVGQHQGNDIPKASNSIDGMTYIHHMYGGKQNWMLNLGVVNEPIDTIQITFHDPGFYTLNGIHVYAKDTADIAQNMQALNRQTEEIEFAPNEMRVKVQTNQNEYLFTAVPYSSGWRAYDNGQATEILQADVGFMAVALDEGEHEVVFRYRTPGILAGTVISLCSLAGYCVYQLVIRKKQV